jgi:hypothetical protein
MPRLRNIRLVVETHLQNPDGSDGQICDRATFESWGLETPEIISMRDPVLGVVSAWNQGDLDTTEVVAAPATGAAKG